MLTGIILAGGKSSRFNGELKSFIKINGVAIIDTQMKLFKNLFDEVIIVTSDSVPYLKYNAIIVNDIIKNKGPLGGIYTALYYMKSDSCFVAACDMPFLNENLIRYMMENVGRDWIYTIKRDDRFEPLHTIYNKRCIKTVKEMLLSDNLKVSPLFSELKAKVAPIEEVRRIDPDLKSLKNINTKEDLEALRFSLCT